jgi:hypothetical protein
LRFGQLSFFSGSLVDLELGGFVISFALMIREFAIGLLSCCFDLLANFFGTFFSTVFRLIFITYFSDRFTSVVVILFFSRQLIFVILFT